MIKGAIFDIDGTLLDSMPIWENAGARYLATLGIKAKPDLKERLDALSLPEGAIYMQKEYGLSVSAEDILEGVNQVVKDFYYKEAVMKPGAYALVKRLKENGVKLIIATATDKEMAKAALIRNGIWQDFMGMLTCEEAGAGKTSPKVFELARQKLGTKKEETWVFEDSLYAVKTATEAGFPVCSIYDTYSVGNAKEIQRLSNIYVRDFSEIGDYSFSNMKTVLTIAGSDSSGGAGIQADIKTLTVHKVYAMTCITALTAQNTVGITEIMPVPAEFFKKQMESIFTDIKPDAVKIGMIASKEQAEIIAEYLEKYSIKNVVADPVMISTSGTVLVEETTRKILYEKLYPKVSLLTPNIPETEFLSGIKITDKKTREEAAKVIADRWNCAVLSKGGHSEENADDLLYESFLQEEKKEKAVWFPEERIDNPNTHGTGCTLSSAVASNLAKGFPVEESVKKAKAYISGAIRAMLNLGQGNGPLNHMWDL